jgi:pyrimidine-specific ribonucleoside hydrolase
MDCDPGHDDAIALILAFASDRLDVKAVTVTGRNQTLAKVLRNARRLLSYIGKRPPLAAGAEKPMFRELEVAAAVHGETGLDGPALPEADKWEEPVSAVELLRRTIMESPEPVALIPTAPLTNIGVLFTAFPEVKQNIARISLMGGSILAGGNWTAAAEFNILVDPEAADIVFSSGLPITMAGLDVTHRALIFRDEVETLRGFGGKVSVLVAELLDFYSKWDAAIGFPGSPLHDPCAVAWLIAPELFSTKDYHVRIETCGKATLGMTMADIRSWGSEKPNVTALMDVDREAFIRLIFDACKFYDTDE